MSRSWQRDLDLSIVLTERLGAVLAAQLDPAITMLQLGLEHGQRILICGVPALSQHLASELVVRFSNDRKAYAASALTTNPSIIFSAWEDYGVNRVFSRQVEAQGIAGDVLVAFSPTGTWKPVVEAMVKAKYLGMPTLGISGAVPLGCDVDIAIPTLDLHRIQELSLLTAHLIVSGLEERLPK